MATDGGTLKATSINGVKTYSVVGQHRSLATWLDPKKRRALRKDKEYMQRVELIQDLRFETACTKIKATPDGEFLLASGIYPPQVKVYELRQLSLKFERHLTSEIVDFEILDEDYSKLAFLCADRSIYLHAKYGNHHCLRIPRMGRSLAYDAWSCDLLCAGSSPDLYRINLQQGRFLSPLSTQSPALNVVSRSKLHGLVACGGEDGAVECFDMRIKSSAGRINAVLPAGDSDQEVTAIEFDSDEGNLMAVGSSEGKVLIYDLRSSSPLQIKDHMYGSPIIDITWHQTLNEEKKLITTDKHVVRIWDPNTGEGMTSIEPTAGAINDVCVIRESGLILLALDSSMIPSYFIPTLGTAPKWCSYLENITEELEESAQTTIYEDYKFLTKEELEKLNRTDLIGTNLLRAYMHGYFIDYRLYRKLKELANPYSYEEYVEKRKKEKLEKLYSNQIAPRRKLPKVNKKLANELLEQEEAEKEKEEAEKKREEGGPEAVAVADKKSSKKKKGRSTELLKDPRFASMFEKEEFNIDEQSEEYKSLHPVTQKKPSSLVEEHFEPIMEAEEQFESDSDADSDDEGLDAHGRDKKKKPRLYEVKDDRHAEAFYHSRSLAKEDALTLEERIAALKNVDNSSRVAKGVKVGAGGSREISFFSKSKATYKEDEEDDDRHGKRRGIQSLGLKSDRSSESRGRGGGGRGRGGRGGSGGHGGGGGRGRGGGRRGGRGGGRGRSRGRH